MKKTIGIVVLFWNDFEKTIECVKSIYRQKNLSYTLILVDNNSQNKFSNEIFKWLKNNNKEVIKVNKKNMRKVNLAHLKNVFILRINSIMGVVWDIIQDINFVLIIILNIQLELTTTW